VTGPLALVGGGEWTDGCEFDRLLLEQSGADEVVLIPAAAAYEHPDRLTDAATAWFDKLGVGVRTLPVLARPDALDAANVDAVRSARFVYLAGESPMHLRSVLMHSPLWEALLQARTDGAAVAGSSAGAMVLCDPMVDPRGGAFTVGLAMVQQLAVIPHHDTWSAEKAHRTLQLAPAGLAVAGIDQRTALVRDAEGAWSAHGAGEVAIFVDGQPAGLDALPG
jgi:cyanophycinase